MIALRLLEDAERAGDRVIAVIRGSAINHDGPSSGFTVPNGIAQRELLRSALTDAGISPEDVQYLEAHGTGTLLGDPIELDAAGEVYGPVFVGSVKANIGHLEAAAGVAGVIKTAIAMRDGFVPAQPGFATPNPRIPWAPYGMRVATASTEWPAGGVRRAAVSAFGLSGSNAHVVMEQGRAGGRAALAARPFERRRFWIREGLWDRKVESPLIDGTLYTAELRGARWRALSDHRVLGRVVVPGAYYLAMAAAAAGGSVEDVVFPSALAAVGGETLSLLVGRDGWRVASEGGVHAEGRVGKLGRPEAMPAGMPAWRAGGSLYDSLERRGIGLGAEFRWLEDVRVSDGEAIARARGGIGYPPGLVDACFQLFSGLIGDGTVVPWRVGAFRVFAESFERAASVRCRLPGEAWILDDAGRVLAELSGIVLREFGGEVKTRPFAYRVEWSPVETGAADPNAVVFAPEGSTTAETLAELGKMAGGRLIVVSRGDGLLRGFTRCLAVERPELRPVLVEDDPRAAAGASASAWRRMRDGRVETARIARLPLGPARPLPVRADATYLVTGGTGSLGRQIVKLLEEQGAGRVVACGRSTGCDVRDAAQVRALVSSLPNLRGVAHAAGIRRDGVALDAASIAETIAAKAAGARNLHEATMGLELDFFVLVSSAAGTLGSPGQAAYGAANAALDALAEERRSMGLPAVSVAWGPWQDSAMVAGLTSGQMQAWKDRGVTPLRSEDALRDLGAVAASGEAHVLYLDTDWDKLSRMWGEATPEFLAGLVTRQVPVVDRESWTELPYEEAKARMMQALRAEVAAVLALDRSFAAATPFFDLGMDSLTALELRNRLQARFGVSAPATVMFDCPSLEPLTAWMLERLGVREELSEEQLERLLMAKIEELEAKGLR